MESLAKKYPQYYKALPAGVKPDEIDTYVINRMFPVDDATGTILHARKKLLIPGVRSGGKSLLKDVKEARDTLNRFIALMDVEQPDEGTVLVSDLQHGMVYVKSKSGMPAGLHAKTMVQVKLKNGTWMGPKPAEFFDWSFDMEASDHHIAEFMLDDGKNRADGKPILKDGEPLGGGWFAHSSSKMPEFFDGSELVEVRLADGVEYAGNFAKLAKDWIWVYEKMTSRIVAWRLLEVAHGSPKLGEWKEHGDRFMPEGLDKDEIVEVKLSNGAELAGARRADKFDWSYRQHSNLSAPHITHWRRYRHNAI